MDRDKKEIMNTTVALVSAYMQSLNATGMQTYDDSAKQYAEFIEAIYKKVESLTTE